MWSTVQASPTCIAFPFQADRPHPDGEPFTYPYDFGWKENFKQVNILIFTLKSVDSMLVELYIPEGCSSW